jgi:hypothetical protein
MLSISFYSENSQYVGSIDYTLDFAQWLIDRGLYRIKGVRACETLVFEEDDGDYEIEVVLLTSTTRQKLLTFFQSAIIQESSEYSWRIGLLHRINDFLENEECLYMDYLD